MIIEVFIYFVPHKAWLKSRIEGIASKEMLYQTDKRLIYSLR